MKCGLTHDLEVDFAGGDLALEVCDGAGELASVVGVSLDTFNEERPVAENILPKVDREGGPIFLPHGRGHRKPRHRALQIDVHSVHGRHVLWGSRSWWA